MASSQLIEQQSDLRTDGDAISEIMDQVPEPGETPVAAPVTIPEAQVTPDPKPEEPEKLPDDDKELEEALDKWQPKTPNEQKAIPALKGQVKQLHSELKAARKEKEDLDARLRGVEPLTPELKTELQELRQLRKAEDPRKDPELVAKYVAPAEQKKTFAMSILKAGGLRDATAKLIEDAGGLAQISRSTAQVPSSLGKGSWAEWTEDVLMNSVPYGDKKRVESLITDILNLEDQLTEESRSAGNNFQAREQARAKQAEEGFNQGISDVVGKLGKMAEKWEPKADASESEKALAKSHNERLDKVSELIEDFKKNIASPAHLGRIAAMAAQSAYLMESNADLAKQLESSKGEIKSLNERIEKIKGSASAARSNNTPPPSVKSGDEALKGVTDKKALDHYFNELDNA